MNGRFKRGRTAILALLLGAISISAAAQMNSKAGYITIVAIMPENLSLSIHSGNPASLPSATSTTEIPGVATGATTAWSLMPGRAKVTTLATVNRWNDPVIIADASAYGVGPFPDRHTTPAQGFAVRPNVSTTQMTGVSLIDANRRGANTAALPKPSDLGQPQHAPANPSPGTLKIQVQPVL